MTTGADIARAARTLLGTPYHHGQSLPGVGMDCIGTVRAAARLCGLADPFQTGAAAKFAGYTASPNPDLLREACDAFMDRVPTHTMRLGDVPVFSFGREPQHFGVITREDPLYVTHAYMQAERVVENILDVKWRRRIVAVYRLRGLA